MKPTKKNNAIMMRTMIGTYHPKRRASASGAFHGWLARHHLFKGFIRRFCVVIRKENSGVAVKEILEPLHAITQPLGAGNAQEEERKNRYLDHNDEHDSNTKGQAELKNGNGAEYPDDDGNDGTDHS